MPPTRVGLAEMDGLLRGSPLEPIKLVSGSLQGARDKKNIFQRGSILKYNTSNSIKSLFTANE